jgi:hypothetical protein
VEVYSSIFPSGESRNAERLGFGQGTVESLIVFVLLSCGGDFLEKVEISFIQQAEEREREYRANLSSST